MEKKYLFWIIIFLFFANVSCWQQVFALARPKYLDVEFLNVGQGDSAFIKTPQGHQILIDGGPDSIVMQKLNYLMPFWDKDLDVVELTHPEKDHMNGLLEVLKKYKADYILWSGVKKNAPEYEEWLKVLAHQKEMGSHILAVNAGEDLKMGNVKMEILYPKESLEGKEMKNSSNDSCIVSKIIYGKNSFLFTGDIDAKAEKKLVDEKADIKSNVLKVAHHGSKYSSSELFLAGVAPAFGIIEVGKNSYGHPTQEVLSRLQNQGIKTERTDREGDIVFLADGSKIYQK